MGDMVEAYGQFVAVTGEWCSYINCGMPTVGSLMYTWQYSPLNHIYRMIVPDPVSPYGWVSIYVLLAGLGTFVLLRRLSVVWWIAAFCGFAFALSPSMVSYIDVGHGSKYMAISFLPWLLYVVDRYYGNRTIWSFSAIIIVAYLMFGALHLQIIYYGVMMVGLYLLWQSRLRSDVLTHRTDAKYNVRFYWREWKPAIGVVLAMGIAFSMMASLYVEIIDYAAVSTRGGGVSWGYATSWSFHPFELVTYLCPYIYGWGDNYTGWMPLTNAPVYLGLAVLGFGIVGMTVKSRLRWFLITMGGVSLLLSFGNYLPILYYPLYELLPIFNKFRCPMLILTLTSISMIVLCGIGANYLMRVSNMWKKFVVVILAVGTLEIVILDKSISHPVSSDAIVSAMAADETVEYFKQDKGVFRVLPMTQAHFKNYYPAHHIESAFGAVGVGMKNYETVVDSLFKTWEFLDITNVKYIVSDQALEYQQLTEVIDGVYLYKNWKPRAWIGGGTVDWVEKSQTKIVLDVTAPMKSMLFYSATFHPRWTATIDGNPAEIEEINGAFRGIRVPKGQWRIVMEWK